MISGVSLSAYWLANYLIDFIKYIIPTIISCLFLLALDIKSLTEGDKYGATWVVFILYGLSVIPFAYFTSFLFKDPGEGCAINNYFILTKVYEKLMLKKE